MITMRMQNRAERILTSLLNRFNRGEWMVCSKSGFVNTNVAVGGYCLFLCGEIVQHLRRFGQRVNAKDQQYLLRAGISSEVAESMLI